MTYRDELEEQARQHADVLLDYLVQRSESVDYRQGTYLLAALAAELGGIVQRRCWDLAREGDPTWEMAGSAGPDDAIDGNWFSRWNGGADPTIAGDAKDKWKQGQAEVRTIGERLYMHFTWDHAARHGLIEARREGSRMVGKYINLSDPSVTRPWIGLIVNVERIDGRWPAVHTMVSLR